MLLIERVAALQRTRIFSSLDDYVLAEIAPIVEELYYDADEVIIEEGQAGSSMYILVEGSVHVSRRGATVGILEAGAIVGELAVIDPAPRAATVSTTSACLLFRLHQQPFHELMLEQPELMMALLTELVRLVRHTDPSVDTID